MGREFPLMFPSYYCFRRRN